MKINHWLRFLLLTVAFNSVAMAEDINQEMRKAGTALSDLIPYLYNDNRFRDPKNQEFITQQLDQLIATIGAQPDILQRHAIVRQISQESLLSQLKQARYLFNTGNYATSQYLLGSAPILCSSCHIQDGIVAKSAPKISRDLFANTFSYAEFNYYVRNYQVAEKSYLEYLKQRNVKSSRISGGKTLERLLDITLITDGDLSKSRDKLIEYRQIKNLDIDLQQRIDLWLQGIKDLTVKTGDTRPIEARMQEEFGADFNLQHEFIFEEEKRPMALVWRAQMQKEAMDATDKVTVARNLYLISILERILGEQTELSLSNLYLKECVRLAVPDYSHRCLNEYESHLMFYYGGSSGENPPPEAVSELRKLRKLLKKGS